MRTTQFIGLTDACKKLVENLERKEIPSYSTIGMFDEEIPLGVFYDKEENIRLVEFEQASPWSSGPMIFTGLCSQNEDCCDNWKEAEGPIIEEDGYRSEYNPETGLYYV